MSAEISSGVNLNRYARQTVLPQVGVSGQLAIRKSKVLLVGAGGLGIPCAQSLVAAGIGELTIIDDDRVSLSNLQRQFLFSESDVGRYKVEALRDKLISQNSEVKIHIYTSRLNKHNVINLLNKHDLVIDGSDNFSTKFLINDACLLTETPWIYASVSRFEGQVAVFSSKSSDQHSCYRCLYEKMPNTKIENCEEQGVFGAVTGIVGNFQALEALKVLMQINAEATEATRDNLAVKNNVLSIFDFQSLDQQSLLIPKRQACRCEKPETIELEEEVAPVCAFGAEKKWIEYEQESGRKILFDVRSLEEYQSGHHHQAELWDSESLNKIKQADLKNSDPVYLYCATGKRAKLKCIELRSQGLQAYYINDYNNLF